MQRGTEVQLVQIKINECLRKALVATGGTRALCSKFIEGRDDGVSVGDKLLPGWTKRRILVELVGGNHVVDLLLKVSDLRHGVAELALVERQRNAVELAQETGTILRLGLLAADRDCLNFTFELGNHGLHFADRSCLRHWSSNEQGESTKDGGERYFLHHWFSKFLHRFEISAVCVRALH
jgi:hypothetical protein